MWISLSVVPVSVPLNGGAEWTNSAATSHKSDDAGWIWDTGCQQLCCTTVLLTKIQKAGIITNKHEQPQNHSQKWSYHSLEPEFTLSQSALLLTGFSGTASSKQNTHICQHLLGSGFCGDFRYRNVAGCGNVTGPHPVILRIQMFEDMPAYPWWKAHVPLCLSPS